MPQAATSFDEEEQSYHRNQDSDAQQLYWLHQDVQISCSGDYNQRQYYDDQQDVSHITYEHSSDYQRSSEDDDDEENIQLEDALHVNSYRNQEQEIKGLTQAEIELIPKINWGTHNQNINAEQKCSICLSNYSLQENLRVLTCFHQFHLGCVDKWLLGNRKCPVCRTSAEVDT